MAISVSYSFSWLIVKLQLKMALMTKGVFQLFENEKIFIGVKAKNFSSFLKAFLFCFLIDLNSKFFLLWKRRQSFNRRGWDSPF